MEAAMDPVLPINSQPVQKPSWNPLKCTGTDLPTNLTVMVKAIAFVMIVENQVQRLPSPWLPFIPGLDAIPGALFQGALRVVFVIGLFLVVFNRRVRLGSFLLGGVILLACLSSKAFQGHNYLCCSLVFLLAALYQPGAPNYWRWQFMIIYFGAGLNKVLQKDWRDGVFFEHFGAVALHQPVYIWASSLLPRMWLARFMCWYTIVSELGMVPLLILRRMVVWAILANIFFQLNLMFFIGRTFGIFTYAMCGASLALVKWPTDPIPVLYDPNRGFAERVMHFFMPWDLDHRLHWIPYRSDVGAKYGISSIAAGKGLRVVIGEKIYSGFRAFRILLLFNPITYFILGVVLAANEFFGRGQLELIVKGPAFNASYLRVVGGLFLVLLFPPLAWIADKISDRKDMQPPQASSVAVSRLSRS